MANQQHLALAVETDKWQKFRERHPHVKPDLRGANLERAHLVGDFSRVRFDDAYLKRAHLPDQLNAATFVKATLHGAHLQGDKAARSEFDRRDTIFRDAHMSDAFLHYANFERADFTGADLRGARFDGAILTNAIFSGANLLDTRFNDANLKGTVFAGARFQSTTFTGARLEWTTFDAVDLTGAIDLESVQHLAPSVVTLSTIYRSGGRVPRNFLLGTQQDAPEDMLLRLRDALRTIPFEYRSCFISYASEDSDFVERLTRRLKRAGVSYWRDRVSLRSGDVFEERISQAIVRFDRFLVVLSPHSLKSEWVFREIQYAVSRKKYDILPITLDDAVLADESELPLELRSQRHVANFSTWRKPKDFEEQFKLLLGALERD